MRFATSPFFLLFLLLTRAVSLRTHTSSLHSLVHHWLHWGANQHPISQAAPAAHPRSSVLNHAALPSYVTGALNLNHTNPFYPLTMMHRAEIDLLASYLTRGHVYLEYGAGGSTLTFARLVKNAYSVEHNCAWVRYIKRLMNALPKRAGAGAGAYENLHMKCVSVKPATNGWGTLSNYEHANYKQFREYVNAVDTIPDAVIDRVFIDGRARLACALKVLPKLNNDSLVFIHDFYSRTEHYKPVLRYYTEVARVLAVQNTDPTQGPVDEPQGLVVLRRKHGVDYNLSEGDIDAVYESIDWRYPFAKPLTSALAYVRYYGNMVSNPGTWARARCSDDVLRLVHRDVLRLALVYVVVTLLVSNRQLFMRRSGSRVMENKRQPSVTVPTAEPSTGETDAVRPANARRKRTTVGGRPV